MHLFHRSLLSGGNRRPNIHTRFEKSAAYLGLRLKTWRESFSPWYSPQIIIIIDFPGRQLWSCSRKSEGKQETSGPWEDKALGAQALSFQLQGVMQEEAGRANTPRPVSEPGVTGSLQLFDDKSVCMTPSLMAREGVHLSQRGKRIIAQELTGITKRVLN